jgi:carboxymethylenebutenolidase
MNFVAIIMVALLAPLSLARAATEPMEPPAGTADLDVRWMQAKAPDLGVMPMAIARPAGRGPFPTVIVLHGTHGFAREYVQLGRRLAKRGVLAVVPCWFSGGGGAGSRFVTPIPCSGPPAISAAASPTAQKTVKALIAEVRALPDVRGDAIALFGHSLGGGTALNYAFGTGDIAAAVLDSAGYTDEQVARVARLNVPILILHGTGDTSADGGSSFQTIEKARGFESALRAAGKPIEATYYDNAGHNGIFTDPRQLEDSVRRAAAFITRPPGTRR